ncbi:MAG: Gfo/Idh/MocA family oxidoreductase [Thermoguttaceae bacterium]|nr:Gfo/Idh/MocA family oxidoreductase [Thermoguttaceae bacterium]MDW8078343.1 Gfo/Idh/MocA family oxidoreductase [Thermoguttaceae bacterium]
MSGCKKNASHRVSFRRRHFLRLAAGTISLPWIVPARALGLEEKSAANDRVGIAMIGVGGRGRGLFADFFQHPDVQVVAVVDCYRDRRESIARLCKGKAFVDFREALALPDVDAVVIATPDHWHVPIAIAAARAGKHAYVEKPLGLSIEQDLVCRKVFAETGRVFQYGTQQRSMPHCHWGCEQVRRGVIGKILRIEVDAPNGGRGGSTEPAPIPEGFDYQWWLGPAPEKPYNPQRCNPPGTYWIYDYSIGYLAGWGSHPLDIMIWGCDADQSGPIVVEGTGEVPTEGLYDTVINWDMRIQLGEVELIFRPGNERTKFIGEHGWIQVARDTGRTEASDPGFLRRPRPEDLEKCRLLISRSHGGNFIEAVKRSDPSAAVAPLPDAVRSDIISHLCDIAVRTGERIVWDPKTERLVEGSEKAQAMLHRPMRPPWTLG